MRTEANGRGSVGWHGLRDAPTVVHHEITLTTQLAATMQRGLGSEYGLNLLPSERSYGGKRGAK